MTNYSQHFNLRQTPQTEQARPDQVENSAGGFTWQVDNWTRLNRFLILGSDGGSYYASERTLTRENAQVVLDCLAEDGPRVVETILEISESGRAPKQKPLLFALALAMSEGGPKTKDLASFSFNRVVRTGTDLFNFVAEVDTMRGWGRFLRRTVANWYNEKSADEVAFQATKYQQRGGWSHRDLLRLSHPKPPTDASEGVYHWITQGKLIKSETPERILGFEALRLTKEVEVVIKVIQDFNMPWETVPSEWLGNPAVWEVLLPNLATGAMFRNLARLTSLGMVTRFSDAERIILDKLTDERNFTGTRRLHPLKVLSALNTYRLGHGIRGSLTWEPNGRVLDALDQAFYQSFGAIQPTNQRIMKALDISGSMTFDDIAGIAGLTPRDASAALALVTANTERDYMMVAFSNNSWTPRAVREFPISPRQRMDDVFDLMGRTPACGTDCALPMLYALENRIPIDLFEVYTDSETWSGDIHPFQALRDYRNKMGIPAKLVVVGMVSNGFSIADPTDPGMLDVVGFDIASPNLISAFARGEV